MTAAVLVLIYSAVVAWRIPPVLIRLTAAGIRPRLGVAVWLIAMACTLCCAGMALFYLIRAAVAGWMHLATVVCQSVSGGVCEPVVYTSALVALGLGFAALSGTLAAFVLSMRCAGRMRQTLRQTRAHADTARIAGRPLAAVAPAGSPAAFVLDVPELAAYCVPPGVIVITAGALGVLAPAQLAAVIAHERAHLAGRHHQVSAITRGLAATLPWVPLFGRGNEEIARLAEMAADDAAARRSGRRPLVEALLALGTGGSVAPAAAALAAAGYAVTARVDRLLAPQPPRSRTGYLFGLAVALVVLPLVTGVVIAYAGVA